MNTLNQSSYAFFTCVFWGPAHTCTPRKMTAGRALQLWMAATLKSCAATFRTLEEFVPMFFVLLLMLDSVISPLIGTCEVLLPASAFCVRPYLRGV